jgi:hypothetical protein
MDAYCRGKASGTGLFSGDKEFPGDPGEETLLSSQEWKPIVGAKHPVYVTSPEIWKFPDALPLRGVEFTISG